METKQRFITMFIALVAMFMGTLRVNAISPNDGAVIAEKDFTGGFEGNYPNWYRFGDDQDGSISSDPDGVAITVGSKTGNLWQPQLRVIDEEIQLREGGNYKVVVTAKFPCNGQLQINMGSWAANEQYPVDVVSTGEFQEVEINCLNYPNNCNHSAGGDAHVLIQCGDFLGTTIVKKIQVWDLDAGPYAVLSDDGKTLTFYCDGNKDSYGENAYDLNEENCAPGWIDYDNPKEIQKVVFTSSFQNARPVSTYDWFYNQPSLTEIVDIQYLNTSEVENMSEMFFMCSGLKELDLSGFDTQNVTDMSLMFGGCKGLTSLNLSSFDTQNVSNLQHMFVSCENLKILDLRSFNTSNVINMNSMFYYCDKLKTIAVGTNWNTANVESSDNMFTDCLSIVGGAGTTYNINKVDKAYAHIDGGESDPGYLSATLPEAYAVYNRSSDNVSTLTFYYDNLRNTIQRIGIKKYDLNEEDVEPGWISDNRYIEKVVFDESFKDARPTTTDHWFYELNAVESFTGLEYLNTSEVTDMNYMFYGCSSLETLTLGDNFDTSNVTAMGMMFSCCENLKTLTLGNRFDTSKVTSMHSMFSDCHNLETLNLSSFNTSNVVYMMEMFYFCENLKTITVGENWKTSNVNLSENMFYGCTSLVGGAGTSYNSGKVDKEYAIADGLNGNPGYLTAVSYGITVSGKAVTFANKYDVLGNETVNYDDDLNILTLIDADVSSINIASTAPNDLHVNVIGVCNVRHASTKGNAFTTSIAKTTIEGNGKLTIISSHGIGIRINRSRTAALLVKDVDLEVGGKTGGIVGTVSATGRTFYSSLGFDNTNCTVARPQGVTESVAAINRLECIRCSMTAGEFDKVNHKVEANTMIIQRNGGISTDIDAIDNGQLTIDKSLPLYNLQGQRVSHPVKGQIYIQNGRKIKF